MSKRLGYYVISWGNVNMDELCDAYPAVLVSMDANTDRLHEFKARCPETFILGRCYMDDGQQSYANPVYDADVYFAHMRGDVEKCRGLYDAWMGSNEPATWNEQDFVNLSLFNVRLADLLHQAGEKFACYSYSVGHPEIEAWRFLHPGIAASDYICVHEYGSPSMHQGMEPNPDDPSRDLGWYCFRYRRWYATLPEELRKPLIIGEGGIDGGTSGRPVEGWKQFCSEQEYIAQLDWWQQEMAKDSYVIGGVIFSWTPWPDFGEFRGSFGVDQCHEMHRWLGSQENDKKRWWLSESMFEGDVEVGEDDGA